MLRSEHHISGTVDGVRAGGKRFNGLGLVRRGKVNTRSLTAPDPVALLRFDFFQIIHFVKAL